MAVGFGVLTTLTTDTPYLVIAAAFAILGAGMSITAAPATGEIMTSVPLSKAGVGSAVNDTTRELGGALGIALLGSVANSAYRSSVDFGGLGLPADAARRRRRVDRRRLRRRPHRSPTAAPSSPGRRRPSPTPSTWPTAWPSPSPWPPRPASSPGRGAGTSSPSPTLDEATELFDLEPAGVGVGDV